MWSDKETNIDYLNFGYLVDLIAKIATDKNLSPSTIGLYGDWGSGKSSLMKLALQAINDKAEKEVMRATPKYYVLNSMDGFLKGMRTRRPLSVELYLMLWLMRKGLIKTLSIMPKT